MDEHLIQSDADSAWNEQFARSLDAKRRQLREFINAHSARADSLEDKLVTKIRQAVNRLTQDTAATAQAQQELAVRAERLQRESDELESRSNQLDAAESHVAQQQRTLDARLREHEFAAEQVSQQRSGFEERRRRLESDYEDRCARTKFQRRRIARELKQRRDADLQHLSEQRRDIEHRAQQLEKQLAELRQGTQQNADHAQLRQHCTSLENQLHECRQQLNDARLRLDKLQSERQAIQESLAEAGDRLADLGNSGNRIRQLEAERDKLSGQLVEIRQRLDNAARQNTDSAELADLKRRYEMALEDLRDLQKRNARMEERLAAASSRPAETDNQSMDWESQKRRLMAALDAEFDQDNEVDRSERLTLEGTIAITDSIVQEKDREIAELREMLNEQSGVVGSVSVGAAAVGQLLDNDEIIVQQRERLKELEKEWDAKLRQAEIDLSVERAEIARRKAELEEQKRSLEAELAQLGKPQDGQDAKASRGRWLARLGLRDNDET